MGTVLKFKSKAGQNIGKTLVQHIWTGKDTKRQSKDNQAAETRTREDMRRGRTSKLGKRIGSRLPKMTLSESLQTA